MILKKKLKPIFTIKQLLSAITIAVLLTGQSTVQALEPKRINKIATDFEKEFRQTLLNKGIPGGAFAIIHKDKVVAARGVGVRKKGGKQAIDSQTVFRLASVSKTFAGSLTALLVHEGKLSWQDNVTQYLPEFKFKSKKYTQQLKVKHLTSQSSGLVPNAYDNLLEANVPITKIYKKLGGLNPRCQPGSCYGYQNVLFSLIEPIIEQATNKTYDTLLTEKIINPLAMHQASLGLKGYQNSSNRAIPHVKRAKTWRAVQVKPAYYKVLSAAGVNASVEDLSKWIIAQLGYYPDVIPQEVISSVTSKQVKTKRDLYRRQWRNYLTDAHYGNGWRIYEFQDNPIVHHGGWVSGFRSNLAYSKDQEVGIVILINAETRAISSLATSFWADIFSTPS